MSDQIVKKHPDAIAWDHWLAGDGANSADPDSLGVNPLLKHYLENRLSRAFKAGVSHGRGEHARTFRMEIAYIGDFTDDEVVMGDQQFKVGNAALVKFPTVEDCQVAAKFLLQDTRFAALAQAKGET